MKYYENKPSNLELIYDYINDYNTRYINDEIDHIDEWGNNRKPKNELYVFTAVLYEYNKGFPKILKNKDFETIQKPLLYHGLDKHAFGANYLWDPMFHMGNGNYGSGMYFSTNYDDARSFVGGMFKDDTKIITAKLDTQKIIKQTTLTRICDVLTGYRNEDIDYESLSEEQYSRLVELQEFLNNKSKEKDDFLWSFKHLLADDPSSLAVLLGAEAIQNDDRPDFFEGEHIIVLKRANLIIPEKCAKTMFKKGGIDYKDVSYQISSLDDVIGAQTQE